MEKSQTIVEFLRREDVMPALREASERVKRLDRVLRVGYFGSFARNDQLPGSDIDILIELEDDNRRWVDRIPEFLLYFRKVPCPVEVFPFTSEELNRKNNPFIEEIMKELVEL